MYYSCVKGLLRVCYSAIKDRIETFVEVACNFVVKLQDYILAETNIYRNILLRGKLYGYAG
jgi:hypothetical protein